MRTIDDMTNLEINNVVEYVLRTAEGPNDRADKLRAAFGNRRRTDVMREAELEDVRADITRTATVVQALELAIAPLPDGQTYLPSQPIMKEAEVQRTRLLALLGDERALVEALKPQPAQDTDGAQP